MLLHSDFVMAEELSMSRFLGGRTGGETEVAGGGEAVDGVGPVSSLQNVNVDVWVWRGLVIAVGVVVGDILFWPGVSYREFC